MSSQLSNKLLTLRACMRFPFPFLYENYQLSFSFRPSAVDEFLRELQADVIMPYLSPKARSAAIPVGMSFTVVPSVIHTSSISYTESANKLITPARNVLFARVFY